jgi:hypothetical protein
MHPMKTKSNLEKEFDNKWQWITSKENITSAIDYIWSTKKLRLHCRQNEYRLLPSGELFFKLDYLVYSNSQTRLRYIILELRHRDKIRMTWLKHIVKVRPRDPSCVAWYTHTNALC